MKVGYVGKGYGNLLLTIRDKKYGLLTTLYPNCCGVYQHKYCLIFTENNTPHLINNCDIHSYRLED